MNAEDTAQRCNAAEAGSKPGRMQIQYGGTGNVHELLQARGNAHRADRLP